MDVPVVELAADLAAFLERAAAGETITVIDGGRPIATLGPVAVAGEHSGGSHLRPIRRAKSDVSIEEVLAEDRDTR